MCTIAVGVMWEWGIDCVRYMFWNYCVHFAKTFFISINFVPADDSCKTLATMRTIQSGMMIEYKGIFQYGVRRIFAVCARERDLINFAICQNLDWDRLRGDRIGKEMLHGGARECKRPWNYDVFGGALLSNALENKRRRLTIVTIAEYIGLKFLKYLLRSGCIIKSLLNFSTRLYDKDKTRLVYIYAIYVNSVFVRHSDVFVELLYE